MLVGGIEERCFASSLMVKRLGLGVFKDRGYASRMVRAILRHKRIRLFPFVLVVFYYCTACEHFSSSVLPYAINSFLSVLGFENGPFLYFLAFGFSSMIL